MNPLEILRYLARLNDDDPEQVASCALDSLVLLESQPEMLFVAIKRLLLAHPRNGLLWSISNRLLLALDRTGEANTIRREVANDSTMGALRDDVRAGIVLFTLDVDRCYNQLVSSRRDIVRDQSYQVRPKEAREQVVYFNPLRSGAQLLAQANPRLSSALVLEPISFSNGVAILPREAVNLAQHAIGSGVRVICRVPCGFDLPSRLFEAQVKLIARLQDGSGESGDDEITDLFALPSFRANPDLVTFLFGVGQLVRSESVAGELLNL